MSHCKGFRAALTGPLIECTSAFPVVSVARRFITGGCYNIAMPIYEYKCEGCGHEFEELVMGYSAKVKCRECGSKKTAKKMSVFGMSGVENSGGASCSSSSCSTKKCSSCG